MRSSKTRVLITAALPYANGPLHFGHISGAYLPSDCYARFRRLLGDDVLFICGSDEYGIAITLNAEREGVPFQKYVDHYHQLHKDSFRRLNISFDFFSRTTNPYHREYVCQFYDDLKNNGFILKKKTGQLYSEQEQRFLADRYVEGTCPVCHFETARGDECQQCGASYEATELISPRSKMTGAALSLKETEHSFLQLEKFKDSLLRFVDELRVKSHMKNFIVGYVNSLKERAITRDLEWGIPVPGEGRGKVFYVWFDAPIGYISASRDWAENTGNSDAWKKYWLDPEVEYIQFVGKDNVPFHAVIFPSMQMGQNQPYKKVDALVASEFYLLEGKQFSKSDGNYIDMDEFLDEHPVDKLRYVLAATAPESSDSEFSFADFKQRCNSDLVGKFGNFCNRVLSFSYKNGFTELGNPGSLKEGDKRFISNCLDVLRKSEEAYREFSLRKATALIMEMATLGNIYFNDEAPWKLLKEGDKNRVKVVLFNACFCMKLLALIACPIMPTTFEKILQMLGIPYAHVGIWDKDFFDIDSVSFKISCPEHLFSCL
ncbi:methionine--tRNA ligase [Chlamydiifrater phoenicopteri]|uniref:methionine--tRNA ligase n=1 Tax=Chlamydiifrater phoenicopteri TaxID=2681469 RepID=UPI001BCEE50E|nr:methionine--tRNA ligase [Chlamydiifrater phoenicopteri]